jgi:hypothetical protein
VGAEEGLAVLCVADIQPPTRARFFLSRLDAGFDGFARIKLEKWSRDHSKTTHFSTRLSHQLVRSVTLHAMHSLRELS